MTWSVIFERVQTSNRIFFWLAQSTAKGSLRENLADKIGRSRHILCDRSQTRHNIGMLQLQFPASPGSAAGWELQSRATAVDWWLVSGPHIGSLWGVYGADQSSGHHGDSNTGVTRSTICEDVLTTEIVLVLRPERFVTMDLRNRCALFYSKL